ncbi:unnamed protein product, partial [Prorocentrum cordatum]
EPAGLVEDSADAEYFSPPPTKRPRLMSKSPAEMCSPLYTPTPITEQDTPLPKHMSTLTPMQIVDVSMDDEKVLMPEVAVLVPAAPAVPGETSSSEDSLIGGGAPDDSIPETEMVEFARWLKIQG